MYNKTDYKRSSHFSHPDNTHSQVLQTTVKSRGRWTRQGR
jgi:hypothetical protein